MFHSAKSFNRFQSHTNTGRRRLRNHRRRLFMEALEDRRVLATFEVWTTDDLVSDPVDPTALIAAPGSLRQAILDANASPNIGGADTIVFNILGTGVHTILPLKQLPTVTDPVKIDGYSQLGASQNTHGPGLGDNAVLQIELDGSLAGSAASGLWVAAGNSTIQGLAVNSFDAFGIVLTVLGNDVVAGNFVGTNATGMVAKPNRDSGIVLGLANGNTIGGLTPASRNVISGNGSVNLHIEPSNGNLIVGNFVGTDATGAAALSSNPIRAGILAFSSGDNTIGGNSADARNIISGNNGHGIEVNGILNRIQGNYVGTDVTGTVAVANADGVGGGSIDVSGNVISGNLGTGLSIEGGTVRGNLIGTDYTGTKALGNGGKGVFMFTSRLGGTTAADRNIIANNGDVGVFAIYGGNVIQGNYIGTDISGLVRMGNGGGIYVGGGQNDLIGGTTPGAGNVIASNGYREIYVANSPGPVVIQRNYVGTDKTGNVPMGNPSWGFGIDIDNSSNVQIGGSTVGAGNIIGDRRDGIGLENNSSNNVIQGNSIGVGADGVAAVPNGYGISLAGGTSNNTIGGTSASAGNIIANNNSVGVLLSQYYLAPITTGNAILGNSIYNNTARGYAGAVLGIDLNRTPFGQGIDGPNPNDPLDADVGNNNLQNYPVLSGVINGANSATIQGTLNSTPNSTFRVEFFSNSTVDPSGYGEGEHYLGFTNVTTDANGNASFSTTLATGSIAGKYISSTTTDSANNTSEFSLAYHVPLNSAPTANAGASYSIDEGQSLTLDASKSTDPEGDALTYSWDVNNDGVFGDATGVNPTLTWSQLQSLGVNDGPKTFPIRVRVTDAASNVVTSNATNLTVANVPPTVSAIVPTSVVQGGSIFLMGQASDPAGINDPLTYEWDYNYNGSVFHVDASGSSQIFTDTSAAPGTRTIALRVSDGDGGISVSSATVSITAAAPAKLDAVSRGLLPLRPSGSGYANQMSSDGRFVVFSSDAEDLVAGDTNGFSDVFRRDLVNGTTVLVSTVANGQGNGSSASQSISADGRYVVFASNASNLVTSDTNGRTDVFLRDFENGTTVLVSTGFGGQSNGNSSSASISADGRYVAFASDASNLVTGDTNGDVDVFRRDLVNGTIVLVSSSSRSPSISADGRYVAFETNGSVLWRDIVKGMTVPVSINASGTSNGPSYAPSISADGRYVAFYSDASILVTGDTNGQRDVFRRDIVNGTTVLVSTVAGGQSNGSSSNASISDDGRYVLFSSYANNLVSGDTNGNQDVFLRDLVNGTTILVRASGDEQSNGYSDISADGRYVVFSSRVSNRGDVFQRDLVSGTTVIVSSHDVTLPPVLGNSNSYVRSGMSLSADGRYAVFLSTATNLAAGGTNGYSQVFRRDLAYGYTRLVSTGIGGLGPGNSYSPSISADGRYVVFSSDASNLVAGDTNGYQDVFRCDLATGTTVLVSTAANGQSNGGSYAPSISADGRYVVYYSDAGNLVTGDSNSRPDVFRRDIDNGTTVLVSTASIGQSNGPSYVPSISADGRYVVFSSDASNLVTGDTNGRRDVFRRDIVSGTTVLVSTAASGQSNGYSDSPSISADGRYVVFESVASNLVTGDNNLKYDVFRRDIVNGTTVLVSTVANGQSNGSSYSQSISADGRYVAFYSDASNMVTGDSNGRQDVFRRDIVNGTTVIVSTVANGQSNSNSNSASISADGRYVAFSSDASNLVTGDTNGNIRDVFLWWGGVPTIIRTAANDQQAQLLIAAVNNLPAQLVPVSVELDLAPGIYSDVFAHPAKGVTLLIKGAGGGLTTFVGHSPALLVESGTVIVQDVTLTTDTDSPTVVIVDGSLTLRSSTIEESSSGNQSAIANSGGDLDLGTVRDPGGNKITTRGDGNLVANDSRDLIMAVGNTFQADSTILNSNFDIQNKLVDGSGNSGQGFVSFIPSTIVVTAAGGNLQAAINAAPDDYKVTVQQGNYTPVSLTDRTIELNFENGASISQVFDSGLLNVIVNGTTNPDNISLSAGASNNSVAIAFTGLPTIQVTPSGQIQAFGGDGNDAINSTISSPLVIDGGAGVDSISGTSQSTAVVSDPLHDTVTGAISLVAFPAPFVHADQYQLSNQGTLSVGGTGVLANDSAADGSSPLVAVLTHDVSNGTLVLKPDGSFTYAPQTGFVGSDRFTYKASVAGGAASTEVIVQIAVIGPPTIAITQSAVTVDINQTAANLGQVSAASNVGIQSLSASVGTVTLQVNGSWTWALDTNSRTQSQVVTLTFTDVLGGVATSSFSLTVINHSPVAGIVGTYVVREGGTKVLDGSSSADVDQPSSTLIYLWDLDGDGIFGETGSGAFHGDETTATPSFSAMDLDGPSSYTVRLKVQDDSGLESNAVAATIQITNVVPTATLQNNSGITYGTATTAAFINPLDPSTADIAAGLHYAFSIDTDTTGSATYVGSGTTSSANFGLKNAGSHTVYARIIDKDGGFTSYSTSLVVNKADARITVTPYSLNYDGLLHTATGSAIGVDAGGAALGTSFNLSGTAHSGAATYSGDGWIFTGGTNYKDASGTVIDKISLATGSAYIMNMTASGAVTASGNAIVSLPAGLFVNSSSSTAVVASGNSKINVGGTVQVVGGVSKTGNAKVTKTGTPVSTNDPLAGLSAPSMSGLTNNGAVSVVGNTTKTLNPGIYTSIQLSGNAVVTMSPGTYIILGGGFTVSGNANVSGSGVTIFNAGSSYNGTTDGGNFGGISLSGNGNFNLSPPTSGAYAGILIYQSRVNTRALSISGNATVNVSGTIYAANAQLTMNGNGNLNDTLIVNSLNVSGNVAISQLASGSDFSGDTGGIAQTLLAGNLNVYVGGGFSTDMLTRVNDTISSLDTLLVPYNVTITAVSDLSLASIIMNYAPTSASGTAADGVLGSYDPSVYPAAITFLQGWDWYAGSDPAEMGTNQYDFQTSVVHEIGHALGLGHSSESSSPMNAMLSKQTAHRAMTVVDLNIAAAPEGVEPLTAAGTASTDQFVPVAAVPTNSVGMTLLTAANTPMIAARNATLVAPISLGAIGGSTGDDSIRDTVGDADQVLDAQDDLNAVTTNFDANNLALDSIMKEWRRTDATFATRVTRLKNGNGDKGTDLATFEATHALDIDWLRI